MENLRKRRVLVAGGAGFIGANLVRRLLKEEAEVHVIVRPASSLWRIQEILPSLHLHLLDLTNFEPLKKSLREISPEFIFNLICPGGHPHDFLKKEEFIKTNVLGTFYLLEALNSCAFKRFVHLGSSLEYGNNSHPHCESDLLIPNTFRGVSKAAASLLCLQFAKAHRRPVVVLRPFSVYGCWEGGHRLIPKAILTSFDNGDISLTSGSCRHDYIFVEDVVQACMRAIHIEEALGEIFNVGSGRQWTNEELLKLLQALLGNKIRVRKGDLSSREPDTEYWVADIKKTKQVLGWEPRFSLEEGLSKTIEWFRAHQMFYPSLTSGHS